ncbi:MAG: transglycosylase SLT domain-containing protein [Janthinobacterium lividum]
MIRQLLFVVTLSTTSLTASSQVLESLIIKIAREEGIPLKLLKSIAYVESGFQPWSLNVAGKPYIFKSRVSAETHLEKVLEQGHTSVDIGCAQINWHWHGKNFKSAKDLLSPSTCLRYAARLLKSHRGSTGSWMKAALLYHSSNHHHQQIYRTRLVRYLTRGQAI